VLLEALARRTGRRVDPSSRLGVDPDAREALAFAVLGARRVLGVASEGWATGGGARLLGKLSG
jgi:1,6-anhydro-N-acetylmuramate kinase